MTELQIIGISISLNQDAYVQVSINGSDKTHQPLTLYMDTETYNQWGNDDNFVENWCLQVLGLERA